MHTRLHTSQDGITLLITLLLMGVLLGVTTSLINVTLKQYQFSGISYDSETAFQAANAGMECAQYRDWVLGRFDVGGPHTSINCMDQSSPGEYENSGAIQSGEEQRFQFSWGTPAVCTEISVYKFYDAGQAVSLEKPSGEVIREEDCPAGSECTYIEARGYNVACEDIDSSSRVVEREYTVLY